MSDCPLCTSRLLEWIWDELDAGERSDYERHLAASPPCAEQARSLAAVERRTRPGEREEPSPSILAGLKAEARKAIAERHAERGAAERRRRRERLRDQDSTASGAAGGSSSGEMSPRRLPDWLPMAASLVLVVGAGWLTWRGLAPGTADQMAAAMKPAATSGERASRDLDPSAKRKQDQAEPPLAKAEAPADRAEPAPAPPAAAVAPPTIRQLAEQEEKDLSRARLAAPGSERSSAEPGLDQDANLASASEVLAAEPAPPSPSRREGAVASRLDEPSREFATRPSDDSGAAGAGLASAAPEGELRARGPSPGEAGAGASAGVDSILAALERGDGSAAIRAWDDWARARGPAPSGRPATREVAAEKSVGAADAGPPPALETDRLLAEIDRHLRDGTGSRAGAARALLLQLSQSPDTTLAARASALLARHPGNAPGR